MTADGVESLGIINCFLREICGKAASGFCENSVRNEIRLPSVGEKSCYKSVMKL